jgi:sugar/nucleoside kinase (ribokinase family)
MFNLITIGDALIDTHVFIDNATVECDINDQNCQLCLNYASKIPITHSFQALGGNAANVAIGTSKLGLSTAILTSVGQDANADMVKENLEKHGVRLDLLTVGQVPTRYSVVLNFKTERTILSYHQKRDYPFPEDFPETEWIYYTSLSEGYESFQENLLEFLNKHKSIRLAYNPGSIQLKDLETVKEAIARTEILIVNLEEAETILGTTLSEAKSVDALIHGLLRLGAKEVVITDSLNGAWAGNEEYVWHCDIFPVQVLSKTGAGDAFSAGYMSARFHSQSIDNALLWGIADSYRIVSSDGPEKIPLEKKEIVDTISQFASIRPIRTT